MRPFKPLRVIPALALLVAGCGVNADPIPAADVPVLEGPQGGGGSGSGEEAALSTAVDEALAAPRPLGPASGASVTSNPPTFRWALAAGVAGARLQICVDRACVHVERELEVAGPAGKPSLPLTPGTHFYRLFGFGRGGHGAVASASIPFTVRRRAAAVDTSWGAAPDFDADGYADLAVTSRRVATTGDLAPIDLPRVAVYAGRPSGIGVSPTTLIEAAPGPYSAGPYWIANAGDLDGDGFTDLLLGTASDAGVGRVDIYRGSPKGLGLSATTAGSPAPSYALKSATDAPGFGARGVGVGDVNGDGFGDLAIAADPSVASGSRITLFYGRASGAPTVGTTLVAGNGATFGAIAPAGDVNGDGYADVLVARPGEHGSVELRAGTALGIALAPLVTFTSPSSDPAAASSFGVSTACVGDVNGDGYADIAVASMTGSLVSPWTVYIYLGAKGGPAPLPSITLSAPANSGGRGPELAAVGDVNGDGFDDLLVGSPETLGGVPTIQPLLTRAVLYYGSAIGPANSALQTFTLPAFVSDYGGTYGRSVGGIGDFDRDGYADVVLAAAQSVTPAFPAPLAYDFAYVHRGSPTGPSFTPSFTLASAESDTTFGVGLARGF